MNTKEIMKHDLSIKLSEALYSYLSKWGYTTQLGHFVNFSLLASNDITQRDAQIINYINAQMQDNRLNLNRFLIEAKSNLRGLSLEMFFNFFSFFGIEDKSLELAASKQQIEVLKQEIAKRDQEIAILKKDLADYEGKYFDAILTPFCDSKEEMLEARDQEIAKLKKELAAYEEDDIFKEENIILSDKLVDF
jgi:hypothetical protein